MKLSENIKIRVSPEEKEYLLSSAGKSETARFKNGRENLSEYLREIIFTNSGLQDKETIRQLRNLQYELRKIGVNVNQIAHKINSGFGDFRDIRELKEYLERIDKAFAKLQEEVQGRWQSQN